MFDRNWLAQKAVTWGWVRLTPEQRALFLWNIRYDWTRLTPTQQVHFLEEALNPTEREVLARALAASTASPKDHGYVY